MPSIYINKRVHTGRMPINILARSSGERSIAMTSQIIPPEGDEKDLPLPITEPDVPIIEEDDDEDFEDDEDDLGIGDDDDDADEAEEEDLERELDIETTKVNPDARWIR
jgi:hypothetical protein